VHLTPRAQVALPSVIAAVWPRIRGHTSASAMLARLSYVIGG